jgi:hypothetical protein
MQDRRKAAEAEAKRRIQLAAEREGGDEKAREAAELRRFKTIMIASTIAVIAAIAAIVAFAHREHHEADSKTEGHAR